MKTNPYAPPATRVADLPAESSISGIDPHVLRACQLMWWSFGAAILGSAIHAAFASDSRFIGVRVIGVVIGAMLTLCLTFWGTAKLKAGRNWMRLLITVVQIGGLALIPLFWNYYKPLLIEQYGNNPTYAVLAGAQYSLNVLAVLLINTPSARSWFAAMKQARAIPQAKPSV